MRLKCLLVAALLVVGCAPDDQHFDISKLTPRHQIIMLVAMDDLNREKPDAVFEASNDGNSTASYGTPNPGAAATTYDLIPVVGWRIVFSPGVTERDDAGLYQITAHELCHVLSVDHGNGNPQGHNCVRDAEIQD